MIKTTSGWRIGSKDRILCFLKVNLPLLNLIRNYWEIKNLWHDQKKLSVLFYDGMEEVNVVGPFILRTSFNHLKGIKNPDSNKNRYLDNYHS
ncbi:MAG: hypothetical protein AAGA77_14545 [Bacteroidota bacterium]